MEMNEKIEKNNIEQKTIQKNNTKEGFDDNNIIFYSTKNNSNMVNKEEIKYDEEHNEEKKIIINRNYAGKFERYDSDYCTNSESQSTKCLIY